MDDAIAVFETGLTFHEYAVGLRVHHDAFIKHYERLAGIVGELRDDQPLNNLRVLAISEDWCPDCVFNVPILARLVEASTQASLRIARRPDCRSLADAFHGRGGVSRVPTFIFLDNANKLLGHWSERCASSQRWLETFTRDHPMPELDIRDGVPSAPLMNWMKLRISSEQPRFYGGVWRDVLQEIRTVLHRSASGR